MSAKENVTIYDISKKLNISAATVSRALNDNPKISAKTKELVLKTAKELNYKQNKLALALKSGKTNTVGVIVPYVNRNFFSAIIDGIENELSSLGYHVIICQSHERQDIEENHINNLLHTKVDGIFMSVSKGTKDINHIKKIVDENIPLVFFDRKKEIPGVSSVTIDDFKGGYLATEHLIKQGAKHIAHFSGNLNLEIYKNRHDGYIKALKDYGLPIKSKWIVETNSRIDSGAAAITELWQNKNVPDAIFSASDYAALGAIQELKRRNINIPEDVKIVGFSNEPFTKFMELPISSVDQTPALMGQIAAQVFLEKVNGHQSLSIEKKVVLAPELKIRKTSSSEGKIKEKLHASKE